MKNIRGYLNKKCKQLKNQAYAIQLYNAVITGMLSIDEFDKAVNKQND